MENQITLQMIEEKIAKINKIAATLDPEFIYFKDTQQILRSDKTEAAYFNNIDYYYILFFERGDTFSKFVEGKILLYDLDYNKVTSYLEIIHDLRTYKSHRLDMETSRGKKIETHIKKWYFEYVGTKHPSIEEKILCISKLDEIAYLMLRNIYICLVRINEDMRRTSLIYEMRLIKDKYLPDYVINAGTKQVIENMQIQIDSHKFVKKYGSQIKQKMEFYVNINKEKEEENLKLCIEEVMMKNKIGLCPLSYDQIKKAYPNKTPKEIGDLKKRATQISDENIFLNAEKILEILQTENQ